MPKTDIDRLTEEYAPRLFEILAPEMRRTADNFASWLFSTALISAGFQRAESDFEKRIEPAFSNTLDELTAAAVAAFLARTKTSKRPSKERLALVRRQAKNLLNKALDTLRDAVDFRPGETPLDELLSDEHIRMIASDIAGTAATLAEDATARANDITTRKWFSQGSNVRPAHRSAHGQQSDAEGFFTVGGERCRHPRDPNLSPELRVNCKCYQAYLVNGVWV